MIPAPNARLCLAYIYFSHKAECKLHEGHGTDRKNIRLLLGSRNGGEAIAVTAQLVDAVMKYKDDRIFGKKAPAYFSSELTDITLLRPVNPKDSDVEAYRSLFRQLEGYLGPAVL